MILKAQVVQLDRGFPLVRLASGDLIRCKHATSLVKEATQRAVIGDWVKIETDDAADKAQIVEILPRQQVLLRKDPAERSMVQVLAANFDTVIIAHPLPGLNIRRLERELVVACDTRARVVVALTKSDLVESDQVRTDAVAAVQAVVAPGIGVIEVSTVNQIGIDAVRALVSTGTQAVLMGRSGAGKSSLINALADQEVQATQPVRAADGKGRHTTVNRTMVRIQGGGEVIDMPGVRGLGLWDAQAGIDAAFPDVVEAARNCRFRDCRHQGDAGCGVGAAIKAGNITPERVAAYVRLSEENSQQLKRNKEAQWQTGAGRSGRSRQPYSRDVARSSNARKNSYKTARNSNACSSNAQ